MPRLTPQHAFSIRVTASMLRDYIADPTIRMDGGFTKKRVLSDARAWLTWEPSIKPKNDSEPALAEALDLLEGKAMEAAPLSGAELLAFMRRPTKARSRR